MSVFRRVEEYLKDRFANHPVEHLMSEAEAEVKALIDEAVAPVRYRLAELEALFSPAEKVTTPIVAPVETIAAPAPVAPADPASVEAPAQ